MRKSRISLSSMHDQTKVSRVQFWIRHVIYKWRVSWNNVICPFKSFTLSCWQVMAGRGRVKTYIGITPSITLSFLVRSQDNLGMKAILFNNHAVSCFKYTLKSENKTMFVLCWTTRTTLQPRSSSIFHFTPKYENICLIS